ncbi:YoaK family protein [Rouxiella chamberiensis]|uniref:YoaK family protein n=1 Tax=Rouxiella chamberiensis TaxID=1513468 RepID=UPI0005D42E22|nr:YoaK family protein [Rouxiella chamberiensis]
MLRMLIKRKKARTHTEDRRLALVLATTAGTLNAMALGAFGFFPSHMTGNTSQLSSEVSNTNLSDVIFLASIILAFVIGSVTSRMLAIGGIKNNIRTIFSLILLLEGVLLICTSLFEILFFSHKNNQEIIIFLAFLMGVHNSTSTQLSNGRVRSTHITGTLTDIGIAFGSVVATIFRRDPSRQMKAQRSQLITHLVTLLSFMIGGISGLLLYKEFGFNSMAAVGVFLVLVAISSIIVTILMAKKRLLRPHYLL